MATQTVTFPERQRGKKKSFPAKGSKATHLVHPWCTYITKNWGNTKGEQAGFLMGPSSPEAEGQVCDSQSWKARGCCNLGPRDRIFHQTVSRFPVANQVFLGFWMVDICQECHSLRLSPQRRHMAYLGLCSHSAPMKLSDLDQGGY